MSNIPTTPVQKRFKNIVKRKIGLHKDVHAIKAVELWISATFCKCKIHKLELLRDSVAYMNRFSTDFHLQINELSVTIAVS